jgi:outer membrane protein TolC
MAAIKKGLSLNVQIKEQQVLIAKQREKVTQEQDALIEHRNQLTALVAQKQKGKR